MHRSPSEDLREELTTRGLKSGGVKRAGNAPLILPLLFWAACVVFPACTRVWRRKLKQGPQGAQRKAGACPPLSLVTTCTDVFRVGVRERRRTAVQLGSDTIVTGVKEEPKQEQKQEQK